ncbi:helix-turn-helix transcriptional regulator [Noviherbaspirillum sedimenti]|uniref:AraC family transcriptional regulator n=1 Tax=Noviherbaspirillum sedimenti TaxID=2320865 RepID=A0A3A3G4Y1_9BURK|nr:helix-turn-helix transcriptional regulator [Noviherbaspirillum sedimenti]RJG02884.1 AraC family transcriptional regulator [Noviherbaspirillum sedimenti]
MISGQRGGIKATGIGRILLWRGGSIWIGSAQEATDFHSHHAIQITLALSQGKVRFRQPDEDWKAFTAVIVPAHQLHAFEARGELVALIFVEPESREGRTIQERHGAGLSSLPDGLLDCEIAALVAAHREKAPDTELIACARTVIAALSSSSDLPASLLDKRIERAIEVLRDRVGSTVTLSNIANAVHLSPERFRHLFLQETGIRFRPYVLWLRLELAIASYAAGNSLTEAAYAGGFADSAHFSRTFRRMFGVAAASIQRE